MAGDRVLIVDDNPFNVKLAAYLLNADGFDVRSAATADELFALLAAWTPQLALMDLRLPGTDGLTLTRRLLADPMNAGVVVVAFSAESTPHQVELALDAGCAGYIAKPIDVTTFSPLVRQFLHGS